MLLGVVADAVDDRVHVVAFGFFFGGGLNYDTEGRVVTEEEEDLLAEEVELCFLRVDDFVALLFYFFVSCADFSNEKVQEDDNHNKHIQVPNTPQNNNRQIRRHGHGSLVALLHPRPVPNDLDIPN